MQLCVQGYMNEIILKLYCFLNHINYIYMIDISYITLLESKNLIIPMTFRSVIFRRILRDNTIRRLLYIHVIYIYIYNIPNNRLYPLFCHDSCVQKYNLSSGYRLICVRIAIMSMHNTQNSDRRNVNREIQWKRFIELLKWKIVWHRHKWFLYFL